MNYPPIVEDLLRELMKNNVNYIEVYVQDDVYFYYDDNQTSFEFYKDYFKINWEGVISYLKYDAIFRVIIFEKVKTKPKSKISKISPKQNKSSDVFEDETDWTGNRIIF